MTRTIVVYWKWNQPDLRESKSRVFHSVMLIHIRTASWQKQQNDCTPSEDSDQPGHLPSLIRVFAVHIRKCWVLSYPLSAQQRLWSDWADAQADLSLRWAHSHFVGFVMRQLIFVVYNITGEHNAAIWEDITENKTLQFVNDCVSFTTTVSAR